MDYLFTTVITQEDKWFVARCIELGVVSQGKTLEKAKDNLKEAIELYLDEKPRRRRLLSRRPAFVTTMSISHV